MSTDSMYKQKNVSVIIPAHNEEGSIGQVVQELENLPASDGKRLIDEIIVCDNASTDKTSSIAKAAGADVIYESSPGYGAACLSAISTLKFNDLIVFVDGDASVDVSEIYLLLDKLIVGADLVIGARKQSQQEPGALLPQQHLGNLLAVYCIRWLWSTTEITDLGPFRAVCYSTLKHLNMCDRRFGWTVEMQVKAFQLGLKVVECPVSTRKRIGLSKISGTLKGTFYAGFDIFSTIFKVWWKQSCKQKRQKIYIKPSEDTAG